MADIALINTPKMYYDEEGTEWGVDHTYPIGLLSISSALQNAGFKVQYVDAQFYHKSIEDLVSIIDAPIVGLNSTFPNTHVTIELAEQLKKADPQRKIVIGGTSPTLAPDHYLRTGVIDYLIRGEGERAVVELLRGKSLLEIKNLSFIGNGQIVHNSKDVPLPVDELPYIDVKNIPQELRERLGEIILMTSRGCDAVCNFCSTPEIWGKGKKFLRNQSIPRVIQEIEHYKAEGFKFDKVYFLDDNFTTDWEHVKEFIDIWNNQYRDQGYTWRCLSRIKGIRERDKLEALADSGLTSVAVGVESVNDRILAQIAKGINVNDIDNFLKNSQGLGIRRKAFFMIGFPEETREEIIHTINYALHAGFDDIAFNIVMAYPSTRLHRQVYGENQVMPEFRERKLEETRYIQKYSSTPNVSLTRHVSIDELIALKEEAFKTFYGGNNNGHQ